ncbi:MAG: hypothetical protein ACPG4U_04820 [Pseudomonadales bacterium]
MLRQAQTNRYLQQLCFVAWTILFAIPLFNNLTSNAESYLALCTQKGVQLVNFSELSQSKKNHELQSCACSAELSQVAVAGPAISLEPGQNLRDYYAFKPWLSHYRPQSPRAPPLA